MAYRWYMVVWWYSGPTGLAQSVERWPFQPVVVGSSPISGVQLLAGHSAVKVAWLVLVTVPILVKGEVSR
jgi:hypothetical protein